MPHGANGQRPKRSRGGGVDLSAAKLTDEQCRDAQESIELAQGARCSGCGRRIGIGCHFVSLDPRDPNQPVMKLSACTRHDCDFAEQARGGATYMEMCEFAWLDANGIDAPAARLIVLRNERRAQAAASAAEEPPPAR